MIDRSQNDRPQNDRSQNWINIAGAVVIIVVMAELLLLTCVVAFIEVPARNENLFNQLVAGYLVQMAAVVAFFVGRNSSNKQSEDTINRLVTNPPPAPANPVVVPAGSTVTTSTEVETPQDPTGDHR